MRWACDGGTNCTFFLPLSCTSIVGVLSKWSTWRDSGSVTRSLHCSIVKRVVAVLMFPWISPAEPKSFQCDAAMLRNNTSVMTMTVQTKEIIEKSSMYRRATKERSCTYYNFHCNTGHWQLISMHPHPRAAAVDGHIRTLFLYKCTTDMSGSQNVWSQQELCRSDSLRGMRSVRQEAGGLARSSPTLSPFGTGAWK